MRKIPCTDDVDTFILGPKVKVLEIQVFSGGAGVFGMDVHVEEKPETSKKGGRKKVQVTEDTGMSQQEDATL